MKAISKILEMRPLSNDEENKIAIKFESPMDSSAHFLSNGSNNKIQM